MRRSLGFTLIELLVVISILGILMAVLLPQLIVGRDSANELGDTLQLRTHYEWWLLHKQRCNQRLPGEGGIKSVLATWQLVDHTPENFDKFFTPGARDNDAHYQGLRNRVMRGEPIWTDVAMCTAADTSYVGRAKEHLRTAEASGNEAWMATGNHGMWTLRAGTVNLLLASGAVRSLSYPMLQEQHQLAAMDPAHPIKTWGADSPIPECRKLAQ